MDDRHARIAVITGAAQGLGRETARVLAAAGYRLVLIDLQSPDALLAELRAAGHDGLALKGDVADEAFVQHAVAATAEAFGAADVLVNNAGISLIVPAEQLSAAQWQRVMDVNLLGPFLLCRDFGRAMLERGSGSIVNVASVAGLRGIAHRSAYNASKHGLIGLTHTLAAEWGGRGVRVNAVCPGFIETDMTREVMARRGPELMRAVPFHRMGKAEEIAETVCWLCSDRAAYVTGVAYNVDGGYIAT